jgi:hypothetical protein
VPRFDSFDPKAEKKEPKHEPSIKVSDRVFEEQSLSNEEQEAESLISLMNEMRNM